MEDMEMNRLPLIGDTAPSFKALTTKGTVNFPEDYKGKWVLFFSHPSDFTPVCTTEFMTLASMAEEFRALNTELLGLSVDSLYSHIAWVRRIEELSWNGIDHVHVDFPVYCRPEYEGFSQIWNASAKCVQHPGCTGRIYHRSPVCDPGNHLLSAESGKEL